MASDTPDAAPTSATDLSNASSTQNLNAAADSPPTAAAPPSYDLTTQLMEYLDPHMIFPLLEFLGFEEVGLFSSDDLLAAKYELLKKTRMVDFANSVYQEIHQSDENAPGYEKQRHDVLRELAELEEESLGIMTIIQDPSVLSQLKQDKLANIQFLTENYDFKPEMLTALYKFAQFMYQVGKYGTCAEMLYHFRILTTDYDKNLSSLWGKLAAEILGNNWETALEDLNRLKELIDQRNMSSHRQQLQQRTWLIHWSLFVFFNHPKGRDGIIDMFFQPAYINTIQTKCPWILRYLATAVITNKKRRNVLKDLTKIVQQEAHSYRDPITEFIEALYINFDFEGAQRKQKECERVLANDFFLVSTKEEFVENARLMIFETYCRIHQCIDIRGLSEKLNMEQDEGEKWIVNLIRNARMDAKIDAKTNTVIMGTQYQSVYQQVIERTRALSFRTSLLASNIEKRENELLSRRLQAEGKRNNNNNNRNNSNRDSGAAERSSAPIEGSGNMKWAQRLIVTGS